MISCLALGVTRPVEGPATQFLNGITLPVSSSNVSMNVARLNSLNSLTLSRTQVTDLGLVQLKTLDNLAELELCDTQITVAAAHELEQSLRSLTIRIRYH